ncbi:hypothetical protein C8J56DRAFT_864487 [Mycena floridula]|nr:hypothetical protein C8J56DRAFT_864487 [Mycena floridula]
MMASATASMPYLLPGVPMCQPGHIEGDMQFATEILPGPPSAVAIQQSIQKRDPRKPPFSFLPASDPGSTYSGVTHGAVVNQEFDLARLGPKRPRVDKGPIVGRAQRASARQQNGTSLNSEGDGTTLSQPLDAAMVIDDEPMPSRSNSTPLIFDGTSLPPVNGRSRRKDKGKAKEVESVRVKEEPRAISLHSPEPPTHQIPNDDHCSSCHTTTGALVYCDGCPKSFHLLCVNPPMQSTEDAGQTWFCPPCATRKHPPRKPPHSLLSPLIQNLEMTTPTEFQLPDEIKSFFKDVGTGDKGGYLDNSVIKPPRLNRHGELEGRDTHRLKDRNGQPVLCFRCGTSALPPSVTTDVSSSKRARRSTAKAVEYEMWKNMISCDYCHLHWHLDCLDPPLLTMPSFAKKWMCPNHSEQILHVKRRIPKTHVAPIEVTKPKQFNNGNIDVINNDDEPVKKKPRAPKVAVDEVLINGRRYRVPERVILLDFWNKLGKNANGEPETNDVDVEDESGMSSPLTSLSSLEDLEEPAPPAPSAPPRLTGDLQAAQLLFELSNGTQNVASSSRIKLPPMASQRPVSTAVIPVKRSSRLPAHTTSGASAGPSSSTAKRKKSTVASQAADPPTRELRSNNKSAEAASSSSRRRGTEPDDESLGIPSRAARNRRVKMEESDISLSGLDTPPGPIQALSNRSRTRRKVTNGDGNGTEKRSRKRKERDDEMPYVDRTPTNRTKTLKTPTKSIPVAAPLSSATSSLTSLGSPSMGSPIASKPPGPSLSLKIRLPGLNSLHNPSQSANNADTSSSRI